MEEIGRNLTPSPFLATALLGATALLRGGDAARNRALLPKIASGDLLMALAVDEEAKHAPAETALRAKRSGKAPSTQAGAFVEEEIEHVREGKHGARSPQQAIAIRLSKARRAGVDLPAPGRGTSSKTRAQAARDSRKGRSGKGKRSASRSRATTTALGRAGHSATSRTSLSKQAHSAAKRRGARSRHQSAVKAVHTKGKEGMRAAGRKAARTRRRKAA